MEKWYLFPYIQSILVYYLPPPVINPRPKKIASRTSDSKLIMSFEIGMLEKSRNIMIALGTA